MDRKKERERERKLSKTNEHAQTISLSDSLALVIIEHIDFCERVKGHAKDSQIKIDL